METALIKTVEYDKYRNPCIACCKLSKTRRVSPTTVFKREIGKKIGRNNIEEFRVCTPTLRFIYYCSKVKESKVFDLSHGQTWPVTKITSRRYIANLDHRSI